MVRSMGMAALLAVVAGCGSDRVIVVTQPPPPPAAPAPVAAAPAPPQGQPAQVAGDDGSWGIQGEPRRVAADYAAVIDKVASMVGDSGVRAAAARRGLDVVNVTWEDTGRAQGSALGPNISDLTLQVRREEAPGRFASALMPVIRFPNFTDRTGDIPSDRFFVRVGNEKAGGAPLRTVALTEVLRDLRAFATVPDSIKGSGNLLAPRDTHFLVSAQAVFLPIPQQGKAEFNPVIFNYQSAPGSPAVLTLLVTREGTSASVIENRPEDRSSQGIGQEIYFNHKGQRAAFTAERKSDVEARIEAQGGPKTEADRSALARGADVLFLVQVPLVHANRGRLGGAMPPPASMAAPGGGGMAKPSTAGAKPADLAMEEKSDVEQAVLGHGPNLGPYNEGRGLRLVRDPKFPIRITVQFYKATSNGVVSEADLDGIARSIGGVYEHADFVGSLVMPEGDPRRPTAWQKVPGEWFPW
ncbi:MAG: hypothetical protein IT372_00245 [Polyangiaceae bacterium]|nr:hypothetical protein [Polyangiaceae bacterium]